MCVIGQQPDEKIMPEINVLSGAAVEPGLLAAVELFRKQSGYDVRITFATTPDMRRLVGEGAAPDVMIAPPAALDEFAKSGRVDSAARVLLGPGRCRRGHPRRRAEARCLDSRCAQARR